MPTFALRPRGTSDEDSFWVYAIDDWDARAQIASSLGIAAHDETLFGCEEDNRFKPPLNVIVHSTGELTGVADITGSFCPCGEHRDLAFD
jgi:hypothetical protein